MRETAVRPRRRSAEAYHAARQHLLRLARTVSSPFLRPRRFHAFAVGMAKSGTHSIDSMFRPRYRSAHEPEEDILLGHVLRMADGSSSEDVVRYLAEAGRRMKLEMNSSQLNYFVLPHLVEMFEQARFVLTVREPLAWLDSMVNQQLGLPCPERWLRLRDLRFGVPSEFPAEEGPLAERNLYTLAGYLSYWARHNMDVLRQVPANRLLVVETQRLTHSAESIAEFVGVPASTLDAGAADTFKAPRRFDVVSLLDEAYLDAAVERFCGPVIEACRARVEVGPHVVGAPA